MLSETKSHLTGKILIQTLFFFLIVTQICFAQWTNIGLQGRSITDLAGVNDVIFVTTDDSGRVLRSTDGGNNWLSVTPLGMIDQPAIVTISPSSGSVFVSGAHYSFVWIDTLYRSTDYGTTWSPTFYSNFLIPNIAVDPNGIVFTGYAYMYHSQTLLTKSIRSLDDGISWTVVGPEGSGSSYTFREESVITLGRGFVSSSQVYLSSDSGSTWQNLCSSAPGSIVSWNSDGSIICGGDSLCRSTDQCSTWTKISSISPTQILSLSPGGMLVATNDGGIFLFSDEGDSIGTCNEGLASLNVHALELNAQGYLYAGTDNGVWRRPLSEITSVEEHSTALPSSYILSQNYPNPFNPSTTIKYSIPTQSKVVIKVYDILGNEIATLMNEDKSVGTYELNWYAENLPSGVYFYQLKAGSFIETKKMLLLK